MTATTLIRGGLLYDGTGAAPRKSDLLLRDGCIAEVAPAITIEGADIIEAEGHVVAPGFVDMHRHCDIAPMTDPDFGRIELAQGITATVVGNCGLAPVPTDPHSRDAVYDYIEPVVGPAPAGMHFAGYADYVAALKKEALPLHMGFLAGAGAVFSAVKGYDHAAMTAAELSRAEGLVAEAMDTGGIRPLVWHHVPAGMLPPAGGASGTGQGRRQARRHPLHAHPRRG